ncbi:phage holin family protein [Limosilactobacillus coleohominis]|uniref:phage holin family protein n=1 Tax=Limosilactobacillus coleohominis TaxID=181675 RepID=UPI0026EC07B1|nr:phage holin family protein [Limosilactobacillus coleohominis]
MNLLASNLPYHMLVIQQTEKMIDDPLIIGFTWLVIFDVLSGIVKGLRSRHTSDRTNSTKGIYGMCKHLLIVAVVITLYPYFITLNFNTLAQLMVAAFSYQYLVSIVENLSQMHIAVWWARPIIDTLAKWLNVAKAQPDYNTEEFDHITGKYNGKKSDQNEGK